MDKRWWWLATGLLFGGAVSAQSASPAPDDTWAAPVSASSVVPAADRPALPGRDEGAVHFQFKDGRHATRPMRNRAQEESGKAPVGSALPAIGPDGRPPVDCPSTPMDPACH